MRLRRQEWRYIGASAAGPWVDDLTAWGIRHEAVSHATRSVSVTNDVLALGELVRLFRRLRPDIVHTHNPTPGVYGRLAARLAGVPVVMNTVHVLYASPDDPPLGAPWPTASNGWCPSAPRRSSCRTSRMSPSWNACTCRPQAARARQRRRSRAFPTSTRRGTHRAADPRRARGPSGRRRRGPPGVGEGIRRAL